MQTPSQPSPSLRFFPGVRVPKYREHVSGQARVTLSGKTYYLGKFKSPESEAEYRRVVSEWLAIGCRPSGPQTNQLTVVEVLDAYWSDLLTQEPSKSELDRARWAVRLMKDHCGTIASAADISPATLRAIQRALTDKRNSVSTVNTRINSIRAILKWAKTEGLIPVDVYERCKDIGPASKVKGAIKRPRRMPLSIAEFEKAIAVLPPMIADMARLQQQAAMRPGEVCFMSWADIDRDSGAVWFYRPGKHKTDYLGITREIPLGKEAQAILSKYLHRLPSVPIFSPREKEQQRLQEVHEQRATPMTPSQRKRAARAAARPDDRENAPGDGWRADSYRKAIQKALKKAGLRHWFPYLLRHTGGTEARRKHGLDAAQALLGHADRRTTERYAQVNRDVLAQIAV